MDFQFIHSVVQEKYVDLPAAKAVPAAYLKELRQYTAVCDCLDNEIGEAFGLVSIRAGSDVPVVFFSHTARKKNVESVCWFTQSAAWEHRGTALLENMDTVLSQPFYTESQLDEFAREKIPVPTQEYSAPADLRRVPAAKEAIRAILYGTMLRWLQGTTQVHIGVPRDEMSGYNDYVLAAAREIYSYFPANMRAEVGFSSYLLPAHEKEYPKFSIIFVPYTLADARTIMLDGSTPNAYAAMCKSTGQEALDRVLDYLARLDDPAERRNFLMGIYQDIENIANGNGGKRFSPMSYGTIGEGLAILEAQGSVEEQMPVWLRFSSNKSRYPASLIDGIDRKISQTMQPEALYTLAEREFRRTPTLENLVKVINRYQPLCVGRPEYGAAVWRLLTDSLEQSAFNPAEVFQVLESNYDVWRSLTGENNCLDFRARWGYVTAEGLKKQTEEAMKKSAEGAEEVEQLLKQCTASVSAFEKKAVTYTDSTRITSMKAELELLARRLVIKQAAKELEKEKTHRPRTKAEIQAEVAELNRLREYLPTTDQIAEEEQLFAALLERMEELKRLSRESHTLCNELLDEVERAKDYFEALDKVSTKAGALSDNDRMVLTDRLKEKRPAPRRDYFYEFHKHYGKALTQKEIADKPAFFKSCVVADLAQIYNSPQPLDVTGKDTNALLKQLSEMKTEAAWFGANEKLLVEFGGYQVEAELVEQVVSLNSNVSSQSGGSVGEIAARLLAAGVFAPGQLAALLELSANAGAEIPLLFAEVISGKVNGMTKSSYIDFLNDLSAQLIQTGLRREDTLDWILSESGRVSHIDPDAEEAIRYLERQSEKGKAKKKRSLIIAGAALGVVIVVALCTWIWSSFIRKPAGDEISTADQIQSAYQNCLATQADRFDLSGMNLTNLDLETVLACYPLMNTTGSISDDLYEDSALLGQLGYLTELDLSDNPEFTDLNKLSGLKGLRWLKLDNTGITIFSALDELKNLEFVSITGCKVSQEQIDLFCKNHPGCFILWTNNEQDQLNAGESIYVQGNNVWDLSGQSLRNLSALTGLEEMFVGLKALNLSGNSLASLQGLSVMTGLEYLDLTGCRLNEDALAVLTDLNSLKVLNLSNNPGITAAKIEELNAQGIETVYATLSAEQEPAQIRIKDNFYDRDVEELDLSGKGLTDADIAEIGQFSSLKRLNLSDNHLSNLSALQNLSNLEWLDISNTDVADLSGLAGLNKLVFLYANNTQLESVSGISPDSLKVLSLAKSEKLTDISALESFKVLEVLDLADTRNIDLINSGSALVKLENLKVLKLGDEDFVQLSSELNEALNNIGCYIIPNSFTVEDAVAEGAAEGATEETAGQD
ncbi:MAG: hypothetical protein SPI09_02390 [Candidatus Limivicinus sp.]|nr:hypothetical protein [Candidatus Limivicinus sp.]